MSESQWPLGLIIPVAFLAFWLGGLSLGLMLGEPGMALVGLMLLPIQALTIIGTAPVVAIIVALCVAVAVGLLAQRVPAAVWMGWGMLTLSGVIVTQTQWRFTPW